MAWVPTEGHSDTLGPMLEVQDNIVLTGPLNSQKEPFQCLKKRHVGIIQQSSSYFNVVQEDRPHDWHGHRWKVRPVKALAFTAAFFCPIRSVVCKCFSANILIYDFSLASFESCRNKTKFLILILFH